MRETFALETERAAILAEYEFVSGLIPLYRSFEMKVLRLAILILTALAVFVASAIEVHNTDNALLGLAFVPGLMAFLVIALAGMEIRIVRASRYIDGEIRPRLRALAGHDVLRWEQAPSRFLTTREARLAGLWSWVLILVAPGMAAGLAALVIESSFSAAKTITASGGLFLLLLSLLALWVSSYKKERRAGEQGSGPDVTPPNDTVG
jgi:hypothetical protein